MGSSPLRRRSSCPPPMPAQRSRAWQATTELPTDAVMSTVCAHAEDVKLTRRCAMRRKGESRRGLFRRTRANGPTPANCICTSLVRARVARRCTWVVTPPVCSFPACAQRRLLATRLLVVCRSAPAVHALRARRPVPPLTTSLVSGPRWNTVIWFAPRLRLPPWGQRGGSQTKLGSGPYRFHEKGVACLHPHSG